MLSACAVLIAIAGLARLALDRRLERPGLAASPRSADAGQCRRAGVGISGGRIADVGICRCQHAATRRPRRVRYRFIRGAALARCASVGPARDRRTIWLPHRKRTGGPARQWPARSGAGASRRHSCDRSTRPRSHHRRHDRRRPRQRMGHIPRRNSAASGTCRAHGHVAGQSRRQHRRPRQSGPARPAVQPGQAVTANPHPVGDGGRARRSRARGRCLGKTDRNAERGAGAAPRCDRSACRHVAACAVQRRCVACSTTSFR